MYTQSQRVCLVVVNSVDIYAILQQCSAKLFSDTRQLYLWRQSSQAMHSAAAATAPRAAAVAAAWCDVPCHQRTVAESRGLRHSRMCNKTMRQNRSETSGSGHRQLRLRSVSIAAISCTTSCTANPQDVVTMFHTYNFLSCLSCNSWGLDLGTLGV